MSRFFISLLVLILFSQCNNNELSKEEIDKYTQAGNKISSDTFLALSKKLKEKMQEGGPKEAIPYCNLKALSITDSMAQSYDVKIKRTSLKIRNSKNQPTKRETEILKQFDSIKFPLVEKHEGKVNYYNPILVQPLCLKCHGEQGTTLDSTAQITLKELYPNDQAINYKAGDVRGIWSIRFEQ